MASSGESILYVKHEWVNTVDKVEKCVEELKYQKEIAVDCEGYDLCRNGTLDILNIGTANKKVFLFDITKMGVSAFDAGLRDLLESGSDVMTKLMYDCRNDSDALMHLYNVKLAGVLDLQLAESDSRRKNRKNYRYLKGMRKTMQIYAPDRESEMIKYSGGEKIRNAQKTGTPIWDKRPLASDLLDYCAVDTTKMFSLLEVFQKKMVRKEMLEASERYVDHFRSYEILPEPKFYRHGIIPDDIMVSYPRDPNMEYGLCHGCRKEFQKSWLDKVAVEKSKCLNHCGCCSFILTTPDHLGNC